MHLLLTVNKTTEFTGFNPNVGPLGSNNFSLPPVPPLPISVPNSNSNNNTSPANVFAQMKSGTFANEDHSQPQSAGSLAQFPATYFWPADLADKYDSLRPARKYSSDLHRMTLMGFYSFNPPINWMDSAVSEPIHGIPTIDFRLLLRWYNE